MSLYPDCKECEEQIKALKEKLALKSKMIDFLTACLNERDQAMINLQKICQEFAIRELDDK